eukprot:Ihof_evm4s151 gene=Ihof_evmTU4s151
MKQFIFASLAAICLPAVLGINFELTAGSVRCLRQSLVKDALVKGEYRVSTVPLQTITVKVTDESGNIAFKKENTNDGPLVFTADTQGMYDICFVSQIQAGATMTNHECRLVLKTGVEAKDYSVLKEAENLQPLELILRKMEELASSIANDLELMKEREADMRTTNESTNQRVLYFSLFSMGCLCLLAGGQ